MARTATAQRSEPIPGRTELSVNTRHNIDEAAQYTHAERSHALVLLRPHPKSYSPTRPIRAAGIATTGASNHSSGPGLSTKRSSKRRGVLDKLGPLRRGNTQGMPCHTNRRRHVREIARSCVATTAGTSNVLREKPVGHRRNAGDMIAQSPPQPKVPNLGDWRNTRKRTRQSQVNRQWLEPRCHTTQQAHANATPILCTRMHGRRRY